MTHESAAALPPAMVEFVDITKEFSGTPVLKGVSLRLERGEVHGLLGENGAGKSTLIKILTGVYSHTGGAILVDGKEVRIHDPLDAHKHGLGAVYQDAELISSFTVAENILLGNEPGGGRIDRVGIRREARRILDEIGLTLDPDRLASTLSAAEMQLVMLAMLFHRKYSLIVLDEPTARLSSHEADLLFALIRRFKAQGITIVYISHRLGEIKLLCDRVTILRGGRVSATLLKDEISEDRVTELMVDRTRNELEVKNTGFARPQERLRVENLATGRLHPLSFTVRSGEVLGITGPIGAGMEEIEHSLGGLTQHRGRILIDGVEQAIASPTAARSAGVALIPEDRRKQALFPTMSAADNVAMPVLSRLNRTGFVTEGSKASYAAGVMARLNVNPRQPRKLMKFFSGGNQQKAVIGKWLEADAKIYIFVEPTAGVDVGAIREIYDIILKLAEEGAAVIVISSSVREILALSESVMVIHEGRMTAHSPAAQLSHDELLGLSMSGRVASNHNQSQTRELRI